ncbi:MAG: DNA alkylation repair protein [Candidatus Cloacimonetes bacterium]|nr:DNA alkylation repair protein [Candidatus Cloacimonadota bacterium]
MIEIKDVGRLDALQMQNIEGEVNKAFALLDEKKEQAAMELLEELSKTSNYFIRELVGKLMTNYKNKKQITKIADQMLTHKIYGIRATAFFFFYNLYANDPKNIVAILEKNYESVPWEVESIIYEMWRKNQNVMKEMMPEWLKSDIEKKRIISFHGMELMAERDPTFVLDFLTRALDDESLEVQKKVTHILLQVVRSRPAETYPYIREWIMTGSDKRIRTLMMALRKILSIYLQKGLKDKSPDFMTLTKFVIYDWRAERDKKISYVGNKLAKLLKQENDNAQH